MVLELLLLLAVWVTAFGLLILVPWAIIHTLGGATDFGELRAYRQSITDSTPVEEPIVEEDRLLAEPEV